MALSWFRLYSEALDDPKVGALSDSQFRVWLMVLMVQCSVGTDDGWTGLSISALAWRIRRDCGADLEALVGVGLLGVDESGVVFVPAWSSRQFKSDSSAERVRRYRERKALLLKQGGNVTGNVTETDLKRLPSESVSVSVTSPSLFSPEREEGKEREESLSPEKKGGQKKRVAPAEKPDPWCWAPFAEVYPGFRLMPCKAAKEWLRRNCPDTEEGQRLFGLIVGKVVQWKKSEQWIQGKVPNCSKFLDERIWEGEPGPPPYRSVQERQEGNREAMAGAKRILGFDQKGFDDAEF